jgi:hypothetical protein
MNGKLIQCPGCRRPRIYKSPQCEWCGHHDRETEKLVKPTSVRLDNDVCEAVAVLAARYGIKSAEIIRKAMKWAEKPGVVKGDDVRKTTRKGSESFKIRFNGLPVPTGPRLNWLVMEYCRRNAGQPEHRGFVTDKLEGRDYTLGES